MISNNKIKLKIYLHFQSLSYTSLFFNLHKKLKGTIACRIKILKALWSDSIIMI
jgi:hypothetical protein